MADGTGLSIGATRLAAVVVDRTAVTRAPVLTLYPHRPPEVGVPSENPNLTEPGLIVTDFVDRVGDPVALVAADGTSHRAEALLAEALRALLGTVGAGRPTGPVAISHPAHWRPGAVDALRADAPAPLVSDAEAALTALSRDPGLPTRGIVAVCDFGGTGTSLTLIDMAPDASAESQLSATVRHLDLSGDLIDQALLKHVVDGLSEAGIIDLSGTSAVGSLSRLRAQCRVAKEQLSTGAVASLTAELPGHRTELRITRDELDEAIRAPLREFAEVMQEALERNGVRAGDLVAVASVGGGARIPAVTAMLSERFRVPVLTTAHPELAAAIGAGVHAARAISEEGTTSVAPTASPPDAASSAFQALAWSDVDDVPDIVPVEPSDYDKAADFDGPRPSLQFIPGDDPVDAESPPPRHRSPLFLAGIIIVGVLAILGLVAMLLMRDDSAPGPTTTPAPVTTTPEPAPATMPPASTEPTPTVTE
ncbi:MAG: Hsp70 family protein, partial [Mycobacterium sp.]